MAEPARNEAECSLALAAAIESGFVSFVRYLLSLDSVVADRTRLVGYFYDAVALGDLEVIRAFLAKDVPISLEHLTEAKRLCSWFGMKAIAEVLDQGVARLYPKGRIDNRDMCIAPCCRSDYTTQCCLCGFTVCDDHSYHCEGGIYRETCQYDVNDSFCVDCMAQCPNCSEQYCTDCLEPGSSCCTSRTLSKKTLRGKIKRLLQAPLSRQETELPICPECFEPVKIPSGDNWRNFAKECTECSSKIHVLCTNRGQKVCTTCRNK